MRTKFLAAALLAASALAAPACADTVAIQNITNNARLTTVGLSYNAGTSFADALAGQLRIRRTGGSDTSFDVNDFFTFCVEPTEFLANTLMTLTTLRFGDTASGGMGQARANDIEQLFATHQPNAHTAVGDIKGAALQIAIWEIVRENGNVYSLGGGNFRVNAPGSITALATSYLASLDVAGPGLGNLRALVNVGAQDLIAQVPEPATMALFGLGLVAVAARRRRAR